MSNFKRQKSILPKRLAKQAELHFKSGFRSGGGKTDSSLGGWRPREITAKRNIGRAILVDTGLLRRDIKVRSATWANMEIGTGAATKNYASVHNKGLRSGRGKGFKMPKREFIGKSAALSQKTRTMIKTTIKNIFNGV